MSDAQQESDPRPTLQDKEFASQFVQRARLELEQSPCDRRVIVTAFLMMAIDLIITDLRDRPMRFRGYADELRKFTNHVLDISPAGPGRGTEWEARAALLRTSLGRAGGRIVRLPLVPVCDAPYRPE
jgi:hypothetical protein